MAGSPHRPTEGDVLEQLLTDARPSVLVSIIMMLVDHGGPGLRQKCLNYMQDYFPDVIEGQESAVADEEAFSRWWNLESDLEQLHRLGGGPYEQVDDVEDQLCDLSEHLRENCVSLQTRELLRDEVLCYIKDCNSGMDDGLDELAFATCYTDADLRKLAQRFEQLDGFSRRRAMEIYRRIGDDEQYLRLRRERMEYGPDYVDLAKFFWERGDQQRALQVAEEGLKQATGALDGLRSFLAQRAQQAGNRPKYLQLEFSRLAAKRLTLQSYRTFKQLCSEDEWRKYEPRVLQLLSDAGPVVRIDILVERKQLQSAVDLFSECSYPAGSYRLGDSRLLDLAEILQKEFPEQILNFYMSGLRDIGITAPRKKYAEQAEILSKVRHLMLQVMDHRRRWEKLAGKIRRENHNKPAFQQEFALVIPDWDQLG